MSNMLHLRPVNGARVLDPDAVPVPEALPVEGRMVVDTPYWRRRLKAKEVERVPESVAKGTKQTRAKNAAVPAAPEESPVAGLETAQTGEGREE